MLNDILGIIRIVDLLLFVFLIYVGVVILIVRKFFLFLFFCYCIFFGNGYEKIMYFIVVLDLKKLFDFIESLVCGMFVK